MEADQHPGGYHQISSDGNNGEGCKMGIFYLVLMPEAVHTTSDSRGDISRIGFDTKAKRSSIWCSGHN
jgi:hypothetical protein